MKKHIFKFIGGFIVAVAGFGLVTMLLWNALLPDIFGIVSINFWQAVGLVVLARVLFSGIGGGGPLNGMKHLHHHYHNPIREKWMKMTPEERKEFARKHHHRGGFFGMKEFDEKHCEPENEQN